MLAIIRSHAFRKYLSQKSPRYKGLVMNRKKIGEKTLWGNFKSILKNNKQDKNK